ncbi:MAG: UDP-4-amino-4,6-dideoxy-N-acetyl-beta-L-altrosamine transaminase [Lachnospiraceae bacterium]|nr:UDP-4-amino-4,6-dideoxy-N-acetyl-beta-L-altrosamine transaminase [Lachnospiraceae bacterium]
MEKLAIDGGYPVRESKIFYGRQWIDEDDIHAVEAVLRSDLITCGPKVSELEAALCEYTGAKYAVVVNSGTSALHCACMAAGIGAGDEIITSPITFAASANCALYCGGVPVFADIKRDTYNIDPDSIRAHITDKTKAIVAVDYTGQAAELDEIKSICEEHGLVLIEDAAHSIGTRYKGQYVGSIADMTCFSFHPVKTITGGEGGAILTNDEDTYKKLLLARSHGITKDPSMMEGEIEGPWYYEQQTLGFNYRLTDFQAALILSQLGKIEFFKKRRQEIVDMYNEAFKNLDGIIVQREIEESDTCRHLYIIRLDSDKLSCTRRQFFDAMSRENVQCQVHYIPVYYFPYYRSLGYKKGLCKEAEDLYENMMSIPLYPRMTDKDVYDVIRAVTKVVENYRR